MSPPPSLVAKVERALRDLGVSGRGLVVAVSGGPDSIALLHALLALRSSTTFPLVIAHLNHQLRGPDSDADEQFVRDLHASLPSDVGLRCDRIDVAARAKELGDNVEGTARRLRYEWLARAASDSGLSLVATGHTADDQAETVLHRLLRGSGLQGLRGIAPRRPLAEGVELIRPLLSVTRAEVLAYLEAEGQPSRHDATNLDPHFTRNRIRHELLPHLEATYNPAVREVLARLASQADESFREIEQGVEELMRQAELPRAGAVLVFDLARLRSESRYRVRQLLRRVWQREGWPLDTMGYEQWRRLEGVVFDETPAVDLPGPVRARRRERVLQLGPLAASHG